MEINKRQKKCIAILLVFVIMISNIMQSVSYATTLTPDSNEPVFMMVTDYMPGGECSGYLTPAQEALYDTTGYAYTVGDTYMYKIYETEDVGTYSNQLYCLSATKIMPGSDGYAIQFENNGLIDDIHGLTLSGYSEGSPEYAANYSAITWLLNNMYNEKTDADSRQDFIDRAFQGYDDYDTDVVAALLTDDDIEIVQQYALWYFTDNDVGFDSTTLPTILLYDEATGNEGTYEDFVGENTRQELANYLYQYLINTAQTGTIEYDTYPEFDTTDTMEGYSNEQYYIAGPMSISMGTGNISDLAIEITDQDGVPITDYMIMCNSSVVTNIYDIIGEDFSIYVRKGDEALSSVTIRLSYNQESDELAIWRPVNESERDEYQTLGLLATGSTPYESTRDFTFNTTDAGSVTLQVEKVDESDGSPVQGVTFDIDIDGTITQKETTSTGTFNISIPLEEAGTKTIKVKETGAPSNYNYSSDVLTITATVAEVEGTYKVTGINTNNLELLTATLDTANDRIRVYVEDERITGYADLVLTKVGEENNPLSGAKFNVLGTEYPTGTDGTLRVENIDISNGSGSIIVTETEAPDGYKKLSNPITINYTSEISGGEYVLSGISPTTGTNYSATYSSNEIDLTVTDELITGSFDVVAQKIDGASSAPLANAVLSINGNEQTTDSEGEIGQSINFSSDKEYETVTIKEVTPPDNYNGTTDELVLNVYKKVSNNKYVIDRIEKVSGDGTITYSVDPSSDTITAVVPNEKLSGGYTINLLKKDSSSDEPLSGVTFNINGEEKTTDGNGRIIIPVDILAEGEDEITVSEVSPKDGYKSLTGTLKVTATKVLESGKYKLSQIVLDNTSTMTATLDTATSTINIVANNEKITGSYTIDLNKIGENSGTTTSLKEAVFEINGVEYTTDIDGKITIPNIAITNTGSETISIREVSAPEGYNKIEGTLILTIVKGVLNEEYVITSMAQAVTIPGYTTSLTDNTITINATDQKTTGTYTVRVLKQSSTDATPLANALISINGEELLTGTDGLVEKTINTSTGTPDTVTVGEVTPPPGYDRTTDVIELSVAKKVQDGEYVIDSVTQTSGDGTITYTVDNTTNTINVVVPNESIVGGYTLNLYKQDEQDNSPIGGVEFSINGETYVTTDDGNIVITKPIKEEGIDEIVITETSPKDGYKALTGTLKLSLTKTLVGDDYKITNMVLDNSSTMTATLDSDNNEINVVATNEKITGSYSINLNKLSNLGGNLTEASFEINGTAYNVDTNGVITIPDIAITGTGTDTITIKELSTTEGYNIIEGNLILTITKGIVNEEYVITDMTVTNPVTGYEATLTDDKTITINATNERITGNYQVKVVKENEDGTKKLGGAKVTVNGVEYTTNDDGIAEVPAVDITSTGVDSITVQETEAPDGYIQTFGIYRVNATKSVLNRQYVVSNIEEISSVDGFSSELKDNIITVTIKDVHKDGGYNIKLIKQDKDDGTPLENVVFTINGTEYTTLDDGTINIPGVFANEDTITVSVEEKTAPRLYKKLNGTLTFDIEVEQTATRYAIHNVNVTSNPEGYEVTFDSETNKISIIAKDEKITGSYGIKLEKVDSQDGTIKLENVLFEINGTEYRTDENGIILIPNVAILDTGTDEITVLEKETLTGYKTTVGTFKLNVNKIIENEVFKPESIEVTNEVTGYSATLDSTTNTINILATNEKSSGSYLISLQKVKDGTTEPISGVRFTINGTEYITNDEGRITKSIKITETGTDTVTIKEESAPTGYKALKDTLQIEVNKILQNEEYLVSGISNAATTGYTVEFDDDNQTITILAEDELITGSYKVNFTKVDENGSGLANAVFTIDGVDYTSGDDGTISLPVRNITSPGTETITIKEKTPPTKYKTLYNTVTLKVDTVEENEVYKVSNVAFSSTDNSGYTYTFDSETQTINIEAQDELLTGQYHIQLFKYNKETTEGLGDVAFDINGITYRTDSDGFIQLPINITETGKDTITIKETEPIDGYKAIKGTLEIEAIKEVVNNSYDLKSATVKTPIDGVEVSFDNTPPLGSTYDGATILVNVPNEETKGNYELKVAKVDKDTGDTLANVPFEINGENYSTNENGVIALGNVTFITTGTDTYTIKETTAPAGYKQNTDEIVVNVIRNLEDDVYFATVEEVDNGKYKVELDEDEKIITVTVYNEKIVGDYDLELLKVDSKDDTQGLENAIFTMTYGNGSTSQITTNNEGKVEINDIKIEETGEEVITFEEIDSPEGYDLLEEPIKVKINKEVVNDVYEVTSAELAEANDMASVVLTDDGKVKIKVKDQKTILGKYNLEIVKTDEEDNVLTDVVTKFEINGENKQTEDGKVEYANVRINKNNVATQDEYSIKETEAPDGYSKFDNEIDVVVTKKFNDDETKYIVDTVTVTQKNADDETSEYTNYEVTTDDGGVTSIKVKVVNYEDLDFSLRKSVTKVKTGDIEKDYSSRLANVNTDSLNLNESSTAKYEHEKEEIELAKGSTVEFTIRLYNEGNKDGYVSKVQDILPEGLELASQDEYEENKIWTYNEEKGAYETNEEYTPELIPARNDSEVLNYQDIKIVAKVKDDCPENINIVNIAQITEIKHKDGRLGIDRDSRGANFVLPEIISLYDGGEDDDLTDGYKPGQEDDDDFERIVVLDYTHVDIALRKFITAISKDAEFEAEEYLTGDASREPVVDKTLLDQRKVTTATYNHTKDAVKVIREDYILYTIRLYNEGNVVGCASQVKDYLPAGVEFVPADEAPTNNIWTYDEETHSITTNENYEPKLLEAHSKSRDLDYQDLTVVCRVVDSVADQTNITNVAEIAEYKFENGDVAEDRDSHITNFVMPEHIEEYNGGEDLDITDKYIPGQEDDDDFERIIVDPIFGYYDFRIAKVDELGNAVTKVETEYKINEEEKVSSEGIVKYDNVEINRSNISTSDVYTIEETKAPNGYTKLDQNVRVTINKKKVDNVRYEVDSVKCEIVNKDGVAVERNDMITLEKDENGKATIVVKVSNYEKLDFTLRKFIKAVGEDMEFTEDEYLKDNNSREPKVNITALDDGDATTATYDHTKEPVQVVRNEYILYTIRIYNESPKDGYVQEVKDYVPEGLEFVKDYNLNRIWDYDNVTRQLTTNDRFEPQLLEGHVKGEGLKYIDLPVILKVNDDVEEDQIMTNIAEITKIAHSDGTNAIDRDSEVDNFIYPDKQEEYNGGEDLNKQDKYVPGQEDDDDFDKAIVKRAYGYYDIVVNKVDQDGNIIKGEATFRINKLDKKTKDGKVVENGLVINKDNVSTNDVYVITEVTAPNGYNKLTDTMILRLTKKLNESRKYYEIDKVTLTYKTTDGYTKDMTDSVTIEQDETGKQTISFNVKNTAKPKETPKETPTVNNTTVVIPGPTEQRVVTYTDTQTQSKTDTTSKTNTSRISNISTGNTSTGTSKAAATGDIVPVVVTYIILGVLILNAIQIICSKRSKENK